MTLGAGEVLVAAARRKGDLVIAVAMRSLDAAADARALLDFGFKKLRRELVLEEGTPMGEIVLDPAGSIPLTLGRRIATFAPRNKVEYVTEVEPAAGAGRHRRASGHNEARAEERRRLRRAPLLSGAAIDPPETSFLLELIETILGFGAAVGRALGAE